MKIFISWSGKDSLAIAKVLRDWIPNVIQVAEPYVSSEDIDKGTRWANDISKELDDSTYGIICLTKNNMAAPWINFEAGALGKKVDKSRVSPFLFKIKPSEVTGPILQFQQTRCDDKEEVYKLIKSINNHDSFLTEERLKIAFDTWWPKLHEELSKIEPEDNQEQQKAKSSKSSQESEIQNLSKIIENVLEISRVNHQLLRNPETILPKEYLKRTFDESLEKTSDLSNVTEDLNSSLLELKRIRRKVTRGSENIIGNNSDFEMMLISLSDVIDSFSKPINYMLMNYSLNDKSILNNRSTIRRRTSSLSRNRLLNEILDSDEEDDTPGFINKM